MGLHRLAARSLCARTLLWRNYTIAGLRLRLQLHRSYLWSALQLLPQLCVRGEIWIQQDDRQALDNGYAQEPGAYNCFWCAYWKCILVNRQEDRTELLLLPLAVHASRSG